MADILIRGLDAKTVRRLKAKAARSGRSLQGEAKQILEHAAGYSISEALSVARQWRKKLGPQRSDSAALIREDRDR
jgi:plasmid stability protein